MGRFRVFRRVFRLQMSSKLVKKFCGLGGYIYFYWVGWVHEFLTLLKGHLKIRLEGPKCRVGSKKVSPACQVRIQFKTIVLNNNIIYILASRFIFPMMRFMLWVALSFTTFTAFTSFRFRCTSKTKNYIYSPPGQYRDVFIGHKHQLKTF